MGEINLQVTNADWIYLKYYAFCIVSSQSESELLLGNTLKTCSRVNT